MLKEILLWIREKLGALLGLLGRGLGKLKTLIGLWLSGVSGQTWRRVVIAVPLAFFLYIGLGMMIVQRVDDDLARRYATPPGSSAAVAAVEYLVRREAEQHNWTPNDPWFLPGWWIDNTPNYQRGMFGALSRFSFELRDQVGRRRGSSAADPDLEGAAGNLSKEPDLWIYNLGISFLPTTPSDSYYREAAKQFASYNKRLAAGDAIFDRRSDNLMATLDRIALDLGASSAALDGYISDHSGSWFIDFGSDDIFFQIKGQVYAYTILLGALREDFSKVIDDKELGPIYDELLQSMEAASSLEPIYVSNGAVDGITPNHLAMQGFFLLRARTQMREVTNILLK